LGVRPVDIKFAYNIIAWTTSVPAASGNVRRTASTREQIGADLARKWATLPGAGASIGSGAVIHKGVVFYVDSNNVLNAYDSNPNTDLDNDLNPDDGVPDLIYGTPYDKIWSYPLSQSSVGSGDRVSTPAVISVVDN